MEAAYKPVEANRATRAARDIAAILENRAWIRQSQDGAVVRNECSRTRDLHLLEQCSAGNC